MATIDELINRSTSAMAGYKREYQALLTFARDEGRSNLSALEQNRCEALLKAFADESDKLANYRAVKADEERINADLSVAPTPSAAAAQRGAESRMTATVQVGREARTYSKDTDPRGSLFLADVANRFLSNDLGASERLSRHIAEERVERPGIQTRSSVGIGTGAMSGLTVPQYLLDMVAPATANLRPVVDVATKHTLPASGMSMNISRVTTGSTAALQGSELGTISNTDMDDTLLTIPVLTAAGQQLVSRQALERAQGVEDLVFQDLVSRVYTSQENQLLNGVTTGMNTVANYSAFTSASPTGPLLYPLIVGAQSQSATAIKGFGNPDVAIMHPRRWYWLQSQMVSTWPMFGAPGSGVPARNAGVNNDNPYPVNFAGKLPSGLDVVISANVSTDSAGDASGWDAVYVGPKSEIHFWEDEGAPLFIRAEQPSVASLGVVLVVYSYFGATLQRYALAFQGVRGTGMVAPPGF